MAYKIMHQFTALQVNEIGRGRLKSSWTCLAADAAPYAEGMKEKAWETYRSDQRKVEAAKLLEYLNTIVL